MQSMATRPGLPHIQYHDPAAQASGPFETGAMADAGAEVVDAPLLILRLAQSRVEGSRLVVHAIHERALRLFAEAEAHVVDCAHPEAILFEVGYDVLPVE